MIPVLNEHGYLPPGIHRATLAEVAARFGQDSSLRRVQMQSVDWLLPLCKAAKIDRLVIAGSFVTDVLEPNDVDCVLLQATSYNEASPAAIELEQGLPFLSLQTVGPEAFDYLVNVFFASDRNGVPRGLVEIVL